MPRTSIVASMEFKCVNPTPVAISPRTAPKLTVHCFPLLVSVCGDVLMEKTCPHLTQDACMITAKPECMVNVSPSSVYTLPTALGTVCSQHTDWVSKLVHVDNLANYIYTCVALTACVAVTVCGVCDMFSLLSHVLLALAIAALVVSFLQSFVPCFQFRIHLLCEAMYVMIINTNLIKCNAEASIAPMY